MSKVDTIKSRSLVKAPQKNTAVKAATPFFHPVIQPKLTINQPNDVYEQEADAVADKVMRMTDPEVLHTKPSHISIQKKCDRCNDEEKLQKKEKKEVDNDEENILKRSVIQRKCAECEKEETLHRKCSSCEAEEKLQLKCDSCGEELYRQEAGAAIPQTVTTAVYQTIESTGAALDVNTRRFMESRFHQDFSEVQIHTDSRAEKSAKDIHARAYTYGQHIVFAPNEYQPESYSGKQLLAHELAHTLQQGKLGRKLQKKGDPYNMDMLIPTELSIGLIKSIFRSVYGKQLDFIFVVSGKIVYVYKKDEFLFSFTFNRKSSIGLEGIFLNKESDLSRWSGDDSWHFIRQTKDGNTAERIIPMLPALTEKDKEDDTHRLSRDFYHLLDDFSSMISLTELSVAREYNVYNIGVVVTNYNSSTVGDGSEGNSDKPRYSYKLPGWLKKVDQNIREKIKEAHDVNPDDISLPTDFKFYADNEQQAKEGENVWKLRVDNGKLKKYITVKRDTGKKDEEFAENVLRKMQDIVAEQNKAKASTDFDKENFEENKVKTSKGSKWLQHFKLRDAIWKELQNLKNSKPPASDIPDKLTLGFYGQVGEETPFFKIWVLRTTNPSAIDYSGKALNQTVSPTDNIDDWVKLIRQQTAIEQLIIKGTDPKEFLNWENKPFSPDSKVQLAPFPAEIIPKNLNPDFTTVKGASNEFLLSLNWSAIYGMRDNLSMASVIYHLKQYYDFHVMELPLDIATMKAEGAKPDELKKASEEFAKKDITVKPFADSDSVQRDNSIEIDMHKEGSFLLLGYANVYNPDDRAPRAISATAIPYFVADINDLADNTAVNMDVVAGLRIKLSKETVPEKRKVLEDQIKEIEERQSKGYATQAREDIGDIDKLITQAKELKAYIESEKSNHYYFGNFNHNPFTVRLAKDKSHLVPIYKLITYKSRSFSFDADIVLTESFIQSCENEKMDLGKLSKRVETPKGKFKSSAIKYKALAVTVDEDNGRIVPVMLLLGEHKDSDPANNEYKHLLFDVTTDAYDKGKMLYSGDTESTEEQSVNSAFVEFGKKNNYGEGKVAYRVPALGFNGMVRSYTTVWEWIEKALMVLTFVLLAFGVILSGGALGPMAALILGGLNTALTVSAGVLGVVMAIRNMAIRSEKGVLEMNSETSMDILNIIGGFVGGVSRFAKVPVNPRIMAVYEVSDFSANMYLVHAKLQEDLVAIKNLNLTDPDDIKALLEQAYAEAEQQGAMLLTTAVAGRLVPEGEHGKVIEEEIPVQAKQKIENSEYQSWKERNWINEKGEITDSAPPYLHEMVKKAKGESTVPREEPLSVKQEQEPRKKVNEPTPTADNPHKPEQHTTTGQEITKVDKADALAIQEIHIGKEDHEVVATKDAIGLCSPECPVLAIKYGQELKDNPMLAERNRQIIELNKAGNHEEAAKQSAALIPDLELARAKMIKMIDPTPSPSGDVVPTIGKAGEQPVAVPGKPGGQTKPTESLGSTLAKKPTLDPKVSQTARKEAEEFELIAHDSDNAAKMHRKRAAQEEANAEKLRTKGDETGAELAEQTAIAARQQAAKEESDAIFARVEAGKLRGGKEGLTAEQIMDRATQQEIAAKLKDEIKAREPGLQQRRDEIQKAREKLIERQDALKQLELSRRTPGSREDRMTEREYEAELQAAKSGVGSMVRRIREKEESLEREMQPQSEAERKLKAAYKKLHDLDKLDKGLSEDSNNAKGDFAEAKATEHLAEKGFEKIGGHSDIRQGIDGIYAREGAPEDNMVVEVKYVDDARKYLNDPERAMRDLLAELVSGDIQLTDKWVAERLQGAFKNDAEAAAEFVKQGFKKILLIYDAKTRRFLTPIIVP